MKKYFTLIELLVVIAIIAVLASISVPVVSGVLTSARVTQAKTEMQSLQKAIREYYLDYRNFNEIGTSKAVIDANKGDQVLYRDFLSGLAQRKYADKGNVEKYNEKQKRYWDTAPGNFDEKDFKMVDPWGNYYVIWIDHDDNGRAGPGDDTDNGRSSSVVGVVHLISAGPDGYFQLDVTSGSNKETFKKKSGSDDIVTWK